MFTNTETITKNVKGIIDNFKNWRDKSAKNYFIMNNENIEITILEYFIVYPIISTKQEALESGISIASSFKIFMETQGVFIRIFYS